MKNSFRIPLRLFPIIIFVSITGTGCKETVAAVNKDQLFVELDLSPEHIAKMERSAIALPGKGQSEIRNYEGVALSRLLDEAGLTSKKLKAKEIVRRYLVAEGADGFQVVFSLAELDTAFTNKQVLLADKLNEKELSADRGPYQLIVEDDLRPTRNCYNIRKLGVYEATAAKKIEQ